MIFIWNLVEESFLLLGGSFTDNITYEYWTTW